MHPEDTTTFKDMQEDLNVLLSERGKHPILLYVLISFAALLAIASIVFTVYHAYTTWKNAQTIKDIDTCCAMCEEPFEDPNFERTVDRYFYRMWERMNDLESAFRTKYPQLPLRLIAETEKLHSEFRSLARFVVRLHGCRNPKNECFGLWSDYNIIHRRNRFKLLLKEHDCCTLPPQPDPWDCDFKCD